MTNLQKRVLEISYKHKLSHLSSCLNAVDVIDKLYEVKKENEPFILSNGHAALALYVVLEKYSKTKTCMGDVKNLDAEQLYLKHGTHPNRDLKDGIYCSTGSLGMGLPVAVGMAIADKKRNVYVVTSDGEMAEGSCWEALKIASDLRLENLRVTVIANGYSAYGKVDPDLLDLRMQYFYPSLVLRTNLFSFPSWVQGVDGHYCTMTDEMYKEILNA